MCDLRVGTAGTLRLEITANTQDASNRTVFHVKATILCSDRATRVGSVGWHVWGTGVDISGSVGLAAGFGARTVWEGDIPVAHNDQGQLGRQDWGFTLNATGTQGLGGGGTVYCSSDPRDIPRAPGKPGPATFSDVTPTGFTITLHPGSVGGSPIKNYPVEVADNPQFTGAQTINSASVTVPVTGKNPTTAYYVRYRATNNQGTSGFADARQVTTIPNTAPTVTVLPTLGGDQAQVTVSPPGGATGAWRYTLEHRVRGTTAATSTPMASSSLTVSGLARGTQYEWRAQATLGGYTSPWSDWITAQQPNPNVAIGNYFDGSTAPANHLTYSWLGPADASKSVAKGRGPLGWTTFSQHNDASIGSGVVYQAAGGRSNTAAGVLWLTDQKAVGARFGQDDHAPGWSDVLPAVQVTGAIWVLSPRETRMRAMLIWNDATGGNLGNADGPEVVVPASTWTRLLVHGTSPAGNAHASVQVRDVDGQGHALFKAGDLLLLDQAMITPGPVEVGYFDGSTPPTRQYQHRWLGPENASPSVREARDPNTIENPLADPNCPPPPKAPRPPQIVADCIVDVGVWRRYWYMIPADQVTRWEATLPTFYVTTGGLAAHQVRIRLYPNPQNLLPDQFALAPTTWEGEQILSFIPARTTIELDAVARRTWASSAVPQGTEPAWDGNLAADDLLYGSGGGPATWPAMRCGTGYLISVDAPLEMPAGNLDVKLALTRRM